MVTAPGPWGELPAFAAEVFMAFVLMLTVLTVSNTPRLDRYTGLAAGGLVAVFITVAGPVSGMSLNPARSLASAVVAGHWRAFWIYVAAPPLGMLLAAEAYRAWFGPGRVRCAKLLHPEHRRCIFCGHRMPGVAREETASSGAAWEPLPPAPLPEAESGAAPSQEQVVA